MLDCVTISRDIGKYGYHLILRLERQLLNLRSQNNARPIEVDAKPSVNPVDLDSGVDSVDPTEIL